MNEDTNQVNLAVVMKRLLDNWPAQFDFIRYEAKVIRARYEALRKEGFSASEALALCLKKAEL